MSGFSAVTYALLKKNISAEIKKAIEGLADGMTFKGSVNTADDLPTNPEKGDLYIVKDLKAKAVHDGDDWIFFDHELKAKDGSITIKDGKVNVNISSEVGNGLQLKNDGLYVPIEGSIGVNFTTDITVGHLKAGTVIHETDTVAEILYRMLYTPSEEMIDIYYGATDNIPVSVEGLTKLTKKVDDILLRKVVQNVETGNIETEEGQYPVFAINKRPGMRDIILNQLSAQGAESIPLDFLTIEGDDNYIYYIGTKTYDEDMGGTNYILTFAEKE